MIRRAAHADAQGIINSHIRSIREICSKDYSPQEIEAWAGRDFKVERWHATIDRDFVWVIDIGGKVSGFGHIALKDDGSAYLHGLYFSPEAKGLGFGKKLFEEMLKVVREKKISKIRLHSTITAKAFYKHLGFQESEGECGIDMQGIRVPCFPMELKIIPER